MRKKTIGEVLRLARVNQKLTLADLAKKIDIKTDYLKALENNQYEKFPNAFYIRSLLRKYAWALDLNEQILLDAYETDNTVIYDEIELANNEDFRSRKYKNRTFSLPLFYFLMLVLLILTFVTYYVWNYTRTNDLSFKASDSYSVISEGGNSLSTIQSSSLSDSSEASSTLGKLEVSGGGQQLAVQYSGINRPIDVTFSATNTTSWLSVSDSELANGITLSADKPSQTVTLSPNTTYTITLGVVKGISVTVDNQKLDLSSLTSDNATITLTIKES